MGAGASASSAGSMAEEPDDDALLSFLGEDVDRAERLLSRAERLMWAPVPAGEAKDEAEPCRCVLQSHAQPCAAQNHDVLDLVAPSDSAMGASATGHGNLVEEPDDETLLSFLCEDVDRAERLLSRAEPRAKARVATSLAAEKPSVSGESGRRLIIHGVDGSTFHLPVDDAATVDDLSKTITAKCGAKPGHRLVLTSGGNVLDDSKPLLKQLCGEEITYVMQRVSAGEAAVSLLRATKESRNHLPSSLQTLTFGYGLNQILQGVTLPSRLHTLTFGGEFKESLEDVTLPSSLQTLTFGERFNQSLKGVTLPSSLQTLTFGERFNQSLKGVMLPSRLRTLTFSEDFNQSLKDVTLPNSLQTLSFGFKFNQRLEAVTLPRSLQTLIFGHCFNQSLKGVTLPSSVQALSFGFKFNQSLKGVTLPSSLQTLTFGGEFDQSLGVTFPKSLLALTFGFVRSLEGVVWPSSLQSLTLLDCCGAASDYGSWLETLPSSLQHLCLARSFEIHL
ncbi:unnamed protein product [Durusdinium trenchii]|uniref:Ubiquitin-like domain-containing protein n=1 Tax=Durusdinium trenchii TaxID=1381693 RepID=A0ABP0KRQ2_9DINO